MKRVLKVLSQSMEGWLSQLRPVVRVIHTLTAVAVGFWMAMKLYDPELSAFGEMVLGLVGGSAIFAVLGYIFFQQENRSLANMMIADFEQMPDRDNKDIWMGESASVNDLIEDLRQLTPRGLKLVRLYREAKETVAKAKGGNTS